MLTGKMKSVVAIVAVGVLSLVDSEFACAQTYGSPPMYHSCAPVIQHQVAYAPQTEYRTVWRPVTVTSYRQVYMWDQSTGGYAIGWQPETTSQWQAQQEAYVVQRPVFENQSIYGQGMRAVPQRAPVTTYGAKTWERRLSDLEDEVAMMRSSQAPNFQSEMAAP